MESSPCPLAAIPHVGTTTSIPMAIILIFLGFGTIVGILAGLLGVGGGAVLVPILNFVLPYDGVEPSMVHHMALGTSMASIVFTSISSARSHNQRGTIPWNIVLGLTPGILAGTFGGTFVVASIPGLQLKIIFAVFLAYTSFQMIMDLKPKASFHLPGMVGLFIAGLVIGLVSSFVGIGGGALTIPFLIMCNIPMINAIGASAAVGFPLAVSGALGYVYNGLGNSMLPEYSFGFVYLPALLGLVITSMIFAPYGVKLSHSLPVKTLKRCFGIMLLLVTARMVATII